MKSSRFFLPAAALLLAGSQMACEDNVSPIGGSIASGEVVISIDSLEYDLNAKSIDNKIFDARSGNILLGRVNVPEYGTLDCSFVTRLLSISQLPDTICSSREQMDKYLEKLDSCVVQLYMVRGNFVGDSLAPQQASIYRLNKQLPNNITNQFDPEGYYDPTPLGRKNYTLVNAGQPDDLYLNYGDFQISVNVPKQFAVDIFNKYMEDPEIFNWPSKFATFLPGLYVDSSFGRGCLGNFSQLTVNAYSYNLQSQLKKDSDGNTIKDENGNSVYETVHVKDSIVLCSTAPEVLSSNRINFTPSESLKQRIRSGENIITTPGGYTTEITFPAREIIEKYSAGDRNISIVSGLSMTIPADTVYNTFGIYGAPYLLLVKSSEKEKFFATNSIPDNVTSFYAAYNSNIKAYRFAGLRQYILDLINKGEVTEEDVEFSLIPVSITVESGANNSSYTYVTKCVPYTGAPTMTRLDTKNARIVFTFSSQMLE